MFHTSSDRKSRREAIAAIMAEYGISETSAYAMHVRAAAALPDEAGGPPARAVEGTHHRPVQGVSLTRAAADACGVTVEATFAVTGTAAERLARIHRWGGRRRGPRKADEGRECVDEVYGGEPWDASAAQ
jgi:hypothetical protein